MAKARKPYKRWRRVWRVKRYIDTIIAATEQGISMREICKRIPAKPHVSVIYHYLKEHPEQQQRFHEARRKVGRAPIHIADDVYDAALRAIATTDAPHLTKWRVPGLPSLNTMRVKAARDPAFKARLDATLAARARRFRPKRFTIADHFKALELAGRHHDLRQEDIDRMLLAAKLPTFDGMRRLARGNSVFAAKFKRFKDDRGAIRYTADAYATALDLLRKDPHKACARILPERVGLIPSWEVVRLRTKSHPEYLAQYREVMEERRKVRGRINPSIRRKRPATAARKSASGDLVVIINASIPRWVDRDDRNDILSEVMMAVLSGEVGPSTIPSYTRRIANGVEREKYTGSSLDRAVGGDSETTFLDLQTSQDFSFEDAI